MKKEILCPQCQKTLCKVEEKGILRNVYLYCKRCKKEIYIETEPKSHN